MPNWIVFLGLGALTFLLMIGWFGTVARATRTTISKRSVYYAATFCGALTIFFLVVSGLGLSERLFGWMGKGS